jgi:hypothetical protein
MSKQPRNLYFSNQVYQRNAKEVQNGIFQTSCKLRKYDDSKSTDQRQYKSMIGSLLYVTTSRPVVMEAVGQVERFQAAPMESHVLAVKRIFRYLKGIEEFGLWYPKGKDISLIAYTDDFLGYLIHTYIFNMLKCSTTKMLKNLSQEALTRSSPSILQTIFSQEALH